MNMVLNGLTDLKKLLTMKKTDMALSSNGQDTGPSRRQFGFESRQRHQGKAKIPLNETNVRLFRDLKRNIEGLSWICELNYHWRTLRKKTVDRYVA